MNLTGLSYIIAVAIVVFGALGQWLDPVFHDAWRIIAVCWIVALVFERIDAFDLALTVQRSVPARVALGQTINGEWRVHHRLRRPLVLRTREVWPTTIDSNDMLADWAVIPGATAAKSFSFVATQLGEISFNKLYLSRRGRLGLCWWSQSVALHNRTTVVPDRCRANVLAHGSAQLGRFEQRLIGSGHELLELRDYRPGDALRSIDWKATARRNTPTVRVFTETQHLEVMLVVDAGRASMIHSGTLTRLGHYANIAAKLAEKAAAQNDHVGLLTFSNAVHVALPPRGGQHTVVRIRRALEQLKITEQESNPLAAVMRVRELARQRCLVVLLTDLDDADTASQITRAIGLLNGKHLVLIANPTDVDLQQLANAPATTWLQPHQNLAAREMIKAHQRALLHLRRKGCEIVTAHPRDLDDAVLRHYDFLKARRRI